MISVNVRFFGPLHDVTRRDEQLLELPDASTGEAVFDTLVAQYPDLRKWKQSVRLAVNLEYVQFSRGLKTGDEVSFIPPVSGG